MWNAISQVQDWNSCLPCPYPATITHYTTGTYKGWYAIKPNQTKQILYKNVSEIGIGLFQQPIVCDWDKRKSTHTREYVKFCFYNVWRSTVWILTLVWNSHLKRQTSHLFLNVWWVSWVLLHINLCRLFNAKSHFYLNNLFDLKQLSLA